MAVAGAPITTTLLLEQLRDESNQTAWRSFDERFREVLFGAARSMGLGEADAADVAQETLFQSVRDYRAGKYDRSRGRLSSWIISIAHHRIADLLRRLGRDKCTAGDTTMRELPAVETVASAWEAALRDSLFRRAWDMLLAEQRFSAGNTRAFELVVIRGVPPETAAEECGISVDQVYVARSRVSSRLREIVSALSAAYEDGL